MLGNKLPSFTLLTIFQMMTSKHGVAESIAKQLQELSVSGIQCTLNYVGTSLYYRLKCIIQYPIDNSPLETIPHRIEITPKYCPPGPHTCMRELPSEKPPRQGSKRRVTWANFHILNTD